MAVSRDILRSYRIPGTVAREMLARGPNEARALAYLMAACLLIFVAQWPGLSRAAHLDPSIPFEARRQGALMAMFFIFPLLAYGLASLTTLALRVARRPVSGFAARLALFWALLAVSPLMLFHGLLAGFAGPGGATLLAGLVVLAAFLAIWVAGLRAAMLEPRPSSA